MNGYYIAGFVLFFVFLIWLLVFDQATLGKLNAESQKNIDRMEKNRSVYRQRLNSRGRGSPSSSYSSSDSGGSSCSGGSD